MERVLLDQVIDTDYGQFDLVWEEDAGFDGNFDRYFDGQTNGLVGAADPGGVYINLARRSGGSPVTIILRDASPQIDEQWQDVVEVSFTLPAGRQVGWYSWAGQSGGQLDVIPAGSYRMRVSARGRDEGQQGEFAQTPVDFYLIELWPAAPAPDTIVRVGSEDGTYWHREIGHRR